MKNLLLFVFLITPFFLFCLDKQPSSDQPNFSKALELARQIAQNKLREQKMLDHLEKTVNKGTKNLKDAQAALKDDETKFVNAETKLDQNQTLEIEQYQQAEKQYEQCQKCKNSPICCCFESCCPVLFECGCWKKPPMLEELDRQPNNSAHSAESMER